MTCLTVASPKALSFSSGTIEETGASDDEVAEEVENLRNRAGTYEDLVKAGVIAEKQLRQALGLQKIQKKETIIEDTKAELKRMAAGAEEEFRKRKAELKKAKKALDEANAFLGKTSSTV